MITAIKNILSPLSVAFSAIIIWLVYYLIFRNWNYFNTKNVKLIRGWPIVGSLVDSITGKLSLVDNIKKIYWKYPNEKVIGLFEFMVPVYYIRDADIVKDICIRDFDFFLNHANHFDDRMDPMLGKGLFFIKDQRWRDMRATLTPAFTGSKMRIMYSLITDCSKDFVNYIKSDSRTEYEMKELFSRYSNDIIATCAFGLNINSLREPNNEFFKAGVRLITVNGLMAIKFLLYENFPFVMKFLNIQMFSDDLISYFRNIINGTIERREINQIIRPDMIHLLMEAKKDSKKIREFHDDDILGQCLLFLFAGLETTSTLLSFMAYELAVNPDIQQRLYEEIRDTERSLDGKPLTYEILTKMKYMDAVVSESLRRWPPLAISDRKVNKPYTIDNNGKPVNLNCGDKVWIPIVAYHMNEQYFPNPEQFDPERFNDENRDKIQPGTYIPFGIGPRNCIGSRFALMECKSIFYNLLLEFSLERCSATQVPLILKRNTFNMTCENGFWIELRPRNQPIITNL